MEDESLPPEQNHDITPALGAALERSDHLCPGINCCAVCGSSAGRELLDCASCARVGYCSTLCRKADRAVHKRVCPLLRCIDDLGVDYTGGGAHLEAAAEKACRDAVVRRLRTTKGGMPRDWAALFEDMPEADDLRVRQGISSSLSYALSLAWCLETLPCLKQVRRRLYPKKGTDGAKGGEWVDLLVLGASSAECGVEPPQLWALPVVPPLSAAEKEAGQQQGGETQGAGGENCAATALPGLRITFVGPEVPAHLAGVEVPLGQPDQGGGGGGGSGRPCVLRHFRGELTDLVADGGGIFATAAATAHGEDGQDAASSASLSAADVRPGAPPAKRPRHAQAAAGGGGAPEVVAWDAAFAFNMGLTCGDYEWGASVAALLAHGGGKPLVLLTNTATERAMDRECLDTHHGVRLKKATVGSNPFAWLAWRQSGTLANDVYRKNSSLLAGRVAPSSSSSSSEASYAALAQQHRRKKKRSGNKKRR